MQANQVNIAVVIDQRNQPDQDSQMATGRTRVFYLLLAYLATAIGIAGAILPLLPATPFLLIAVWAASRGSQRVHDWIYDQPQYARLLNDWHEQGAVPVSAKLLATLMMIFSWSYLVFFEYHWGLLLGMSLLFLCIGTFLWTRPNPKY